MVVEIPEHLENEISYKAQEQKFQLIYNVTFDNEQEYTKYTMSPFKFQDNLLKQYLHLKNDLEGVSDDFKYDIFQVAFEFLIASLEKMKRWLPFENQILFNTEVIYLKSYDYDKWVDLKDKFPNIIKEEDKSSFQEQIQRLKYHYLDIKGDISHYPILEVWRKNKLKFPLLYQLVRALMVTPYSSCSIERIFSKCKDVKTLKRNRLSTQNLESCLLIKQEYGESNFGFSEEMFSRFNESEKIEEESNENKTSHKNLVNPFSVPKKSELKEISMEIEEDNLNLKENNLKSDPLYLSASILTQSIFDIAAKGFEKMISGVSSKEDVVQLKRLSDYKLPLLYDIKKVNRNDSKGISSDLKVNFQGSSNQIPANKEDVDFPIPSSLFKESQDNLNDRDQNRSDDFDEKLSEELSKSSFRD